MGAVIGMLAEPGRVDDLLDNQAVQLKQQGVETRHVPAGPGAHYQGFSHQQLYDMVNNQVDPGTVGAAGDTWTKLGQKFAGFTEKVVGALGSSEINWTGKAGDGARGALAKIANSAGETGTAAQLAGTLAAQQSRALSTAKASVPPPPAEPFDARAANAKRAEITDPAAYAKQEQADAAAFSAQKQQHEEAARKVETYDRTMTQVATAQPAFAPAPPTAPKVPGEPSSPVVPNPGFTGQGNTQPPQVGGNDTTNTSWTAPPGTGNGTTNTSGLNNNLGLGGTGQPGLGGGNNQHNLGLGVSPAPGPNSGVRGSQSGRTAGGGPGGRGGGTGMGSGRMPGGSAGIGGSNAAARGFGPGGSSGVLPPGESAAGRGGAASGGGAAGRGGAGAGAMGGMGAGGAKGEGGEDLERTTPSYLLEPDLDEIFGNGELVAPPVIGG